MTRNTLAIEELALGSFALPQAPSFPQKRIISSDGGPLYAETDFSDFPVEPWNTYSEIAVLFVAIYWWGVLRKQSRSRGIIGTAVLLLALQWLGATLYHAFRSHSFWLMLDVVPILLFTVLLNAASFIRAARRSALNAISTLAAVAVVALFIRAFPAINPWQSSGAYFFLMLGTITVLAGEIVGRRAKNWKRPLCSLLALALSFAIALSARELDAAVPPLLPMGTHFIWHLMAAATAHLFLSFHLLMTESE